MHPNAATAADPDGDERPAVGGDDAPLATTDADERGDDDDVVVLSWWQHPVNVVALVVSALLIAGMAGWLVGRTSQDVATGDVDTGFLQDMRVHHEQAVFMSTIFLELDGTEPGLRTVARTIVQGQSIEIGRMIQLLRDAGQPEAADTSGEAMGWMDMATPYDAMPGMASEAELDELAASSGRTADELFAAMMIAHHEGGIHMAEYAAEHAGSAEVRAMAASMVRGQTGEITELQGLLAS